MKAKELTKEEFIKALFKWNRCYLKKPKSWQKIWMWWEKDKNDPKERWFMNVAVSTRTGIEESSWITAKQLEDWLDYRERQGYKFYADE
jgi:hypothetical protein